MCIFVPYRAVLREICHLTATSQTHPDGDENGQPDDQPVIHVIVSGPATSKRPKGRRRKSFSSLLKSLAFHSVPAMQMENNIKD